MKRHKSLVPLSQDHHNGLMLAQLIKKDAPEYKGLPTDIKGKIKFTLESWEVELKPHFFNEENILFPAVSGKKDDIDKLVSELKKEHRSIENKIKDLDEKSETGSNLNDLGHMIEKHIRKEERILFQQLQLVCPDELKKIEGKIIPVNKSCKI